MEMILEDIERALKAELFYVAIATSLTIPDICACLEQDSGETTGKNKALYVDWYNRYMADKYQNLTGEDCYSLRNGVIHNGKFGHDRMQYSRVLFTIPSRNTYHQSVLMDAYNLDSCIFCRDFIASAKQWMSDTRTNFIVRRNMPRLVQFRPNGLSPYMVGMPLIS